MTKKNYLLSSPQQEIWFDQMFYPDVNLYNLGYYVRINGPINPTIFEKTINIFIQHNDALHTILHTGNEIPTHKFLGKIDFRLNIQDFSNKNNPSQSTIKWIKQELVKPFKLHDELLFQFALCKVSDNCYYWFIKYYHLITDNWGISLTVQHVASIYNSLLNGEHYHKNHYSYLDFIKDDVKYLTSKKFTTHQKYWQNKYCKQPEPFLVNNCTTQLQNVYRSTLKIERSYYNQLATFAKKNNVSTFHVILGVLYCYFVRTYDRNDFIIGLSTLNRNNAAFKKTVGLFTTVIPAWFNLGVELNFVELIRSISKELKKDYRNQRLPPSEINRQIKLQLFNIIIAYAKQDFDVDFNGSPTKTTYLSNGVYPQKDALFIFVEEFHKEHDVNIYFDYNLNFFNQDEVELITSRFKFLFREILLKPDIPIQELQIIPETELNRLLVEFNNTKTDYPQNKTIVDLFEEQVAKSPEAIAVVFEDKQLTYKELNSKANQLAYHLQTLGIKPEVLIGICVERSLEMVIGLLGVLKAGGAYLPLDPNYPKSRLDFMLEDAQISILLTQKKLVEKLPVHKTICLDVDWKTIAKTPNNNLSIKYNKLAYVIYTSGSTGKPKGVKLSHKNLINLVFWHVDFFSVTSKDKATHLANVAFDASVWELWPYLAVGSTVYLIDLDIIKTSYWNWLANNQITISFIPTPLLEELLSLQLPNNLALKKLLIGGDKLIKIPDNSLPFQIINNYGPTENTVVTTSGVISNNTSLHIGRPINNVQTYILDNYKKPVPINVFGELYIGGSSLSVGYLNRPKLTAEKFIKNPFSKDSRLYKTGDLARYLPDGNIEFLGRIDNQVKIRGFRIELGEIETVLTKQASIRETVVIFEADKLTAYVVPKSYECDEITQNEYISNWENIYKDVYSHNNLTSNSSAWNSSYTGLSIQAKLDSQSTNAEIDSSFNISGWNSSYTGLPIPAKEMREWVNSTVKLIKSLQPNKVLEIGCGTGLLLSRIAPNCQKYWATDFSPIVLQQLEQLKDITNNLSHIKLFNRKADDFTNIKPNSFDTVIINSVIQYFPSINYLLKVLEQAVKVVKPGGHIFIGDIRNLKLLKTYQTSVQLYKAPNSPITTKLTPEEELLIDPNFFLSLTQHFDNIQNVQIELKRGNYVNELTKFRYEVILQVGKKILPKVEIPWQNWQSLAVTQQTLLQEQPDVLGLRNVSNSRIEADIQALEWLVENPEKAIGQYKQQQLSGINPEQFYNLVNDLPYTINISWATDNGCYDVLFKHKKLANVQTFEPVQVQPWYKYANNPLQDKLAETLIPQLRQHLQEQLPDYMIPSAFVLLDSIPLTPNGKVDRQSLAKLAGTSTKIFVAPRAPEEELLANIWQEVLGIKQIGIHDNFFELGGHSLLATKIISRIRDTFEIELSLHKLFATPTIADLIKQLKNHHQASLSPIIPVSRLKPLQLSFAQQRLWFLNQLEGASPTYNMPAALLLEGTLNQKLLEQSLRILIQRHESLRTIFTTIDGQPIVNLTNVDYKLTVVKLKNIASAEIDRLINEEAHKPFDLETGPLFRTKLIQLDIKMHILLINMHHIISDGWSIAIFAREWNVIFKALVENEKINLPSLSIQYVDYANWQRQRLTGELLEQQISYWKQQLANISTLLELPTDNKRPPIQSFNGTALPFTLSADLTSALKQLSQRTETTLFMVLWSAFAVLLSRYSGQSDIVIGSPIANRTHSQIESIIGFFVNTLALRLDLNNNPSFEQVLQQARKVALEAYNHQDIPFERLVEILQPERNLSHTPLLQVIFALHNVSIPNSKLVGLDVTFLKLESITAKFDLFLSLEETASGLVGMLEYNTDLFERTTIERLSGHFQTLLAGIIENPEAFIHELPLLTEAEQQQFLTWNNTQTDYPQEKTIVDLFEEQVAKNPEAIAVVFEDKQLTYKELNNKANQLAHHLQTLGVKPEVLVGICVERSLEMVIGLLGILKAGGAYLPLDPNYPKLRLDFMLEDAQISILLTQKKLVEQLPKHKAQILCLDTDWEFITKLPNNNLSSIVQPSNLAYVIYTSGSTGKPKGVLITHQGLGNLAQTQIKLFNVQSDSKILQFASFSFDASVWEIVMSIVSGAKLYLAKADDLLPGLGLIKLLQKNNITHITIPPTILATLPTDDKLNLKCIVVAGESCSPELAKKWSKKARFFNAYGPTENTICATIFEYINNNSAKFSIGKPINNVQTYILDRYLQPVPIGVSGELHIGGIGLARGYLNNPELTAEKFIKNPFSKDSRLYKTGDLARYLPDGNIEFLGRIDNQVKIRGFRIELGEIETVLTKHSSIKESIILSNEIKSDDQRLTAYIVPNSSIEQENSSQETISQWQELFEGSYNQPVIDKTFNITSWNSSYTDLPIPAEEMQEWVHSTVKLIKSLQPNKVLEIGCGTGLLLSRIAPNCQKYWATDFSPIVLQQLEQLKNTTNNLSHIKLFNCKADDFTNIKPKSFDTVIINSVIQYFPSINYLLKVLEQAVEAVKPDGHIFIGDIRNLKLLKIYQTSVQLYQASDSTIASELPASKEEELLIDPDFFLALTQHIDNIQNVQVELKQGNYVNELTKFRYEVILQVGKETLPKVEILWQDWQSLEVTKQTLLEKQPEILGLRNVPNSRIEADIQAAEWLVENPEQAIDQYKQQQLNGLNPEQFWNLVNDLPYIVNISWATDNGCYDVLFKHKKLANVQTFEPIQVQSWHKYANNPLQDKLAETLIPQLRKYLQEQLPDYMIPSGFVLLDSMPLTPNGKVDRKTLAKLEIDKHQSVEEFVVPRNDTEKLLASIWQELLQVKQIGIRDNFFELGGHSLLAIRLVTKIQQQFDKELPIAILFQNPTIESLSNFIQQNSQANCSSLVDIQTKGDNLPFFCVHSGGGDVFVYNNLAKNIGSNQPFYGLQSSGLNEIWEPLNSVESMAGYYLEAIQKVQPQGPYQLGGWCFGGIVAFEMANQLHKQGQEVKLLILIDTYSPTAFRSKNQLDKIKLLSFLLKNTGYIFDKDLSIFVDNLLAEHKKLLFYFLIKNFTKFFKNDLLEFAGELLTNLDENALVDFLIKNVKSDKLNNEVSEKSDIQYFMELAKNANIISPERKTQLLQIIKANMKAMCNYKPQSHAGKIVLLSANKPAQGIDKYLGWQNLAKDGVEVHSFPGDHYDLMQEPNVSLIAEKLESYLG